VKDGVNEAAGKYRAPKTTTNSYNVGKAITSVVAAGHPKDLSNVAEDLGRHVTFLKNALRA
jgi:hypothetical protein